MAKPGLLDQPELLAAMLSGKYMVQTRAGRVVGTFDTKPEAVNAALDDSANSLTITDPAAPDKLDEMRRGIIRGIEKRKAQGEFIPAATLRLVESFPVDAAAT